MIRTLAWVLGFASWFWIDSSFGDPAFLKNIGLPIALPMFLLIAPVGWPRSRAFLAGLLVLAWGWGRIGVLAPTEDSSLFLAAGSLAFLVGATGARPPAWIALGCLLMAMGRGWWDLLLVSNMGHGIPFTATSFFVHKNLFGLVLAPCVLLLLGWTLGQPRGIVRSASWWLLGLSLALLLVAGSNGAVLGFLVGSGVVLVRRILRRRGGRLALAAGATGAMLLLGGAFFTASGRLAQGVGEVGSIIEGKPIDTDVPYRFRSWVWTGSLRLWGEAPVLGIGVGDFRYAIESRLDPWADSYRLRARKVGVAHSHWVHTLVERGAMGLTLELVLVALALTSAFASGRPFLGGAILCMAAHGLVAEGLEYALGSVLWWFLLGSAIAVPSVGTGSRRVVVAVGGLALLLVAWPVRRALEVNLAESRLSLVASSPQASQEIWNLLQSAPRSKHLLLALARSQVESGDLQGARSTLEHARSLYPRYGAVDLEVPISGVWRKVGLLDSARSLTDSMLSRYPWDPWLLHERMRILRETEGCSSVRASIDRKDTTMSRLLAPVVVRTGPRSFRERIALDEARADSVRAFLATAEESELERARIEWARVRRFCLEGA